MSATAIHVTLVHEGGAVDVAAAPGTSVDELLGSQRIVPDARPAAIATPSGLPIETGGLIGQDVAEGSVLVITDAVDTNGRATTHPRPASWAAVRPPFWLAEATAVLLAALMLAFVFAGILTGTSVLSLPVRVTAAVMLLALLAALGLPQRASCTPTSAALFTLSLPLLGASMSALLVPPTNPDWALLATLVALWGAAATAMALWLRHRGPSDAVAAATWAAAATVVTVGAALGISATTLALLTAALAALGGLLISGAALASVPDRQLLDMTGQRAAGQSVRAPTTAPPVQVTRARTRRTVADAEAVSVALEIALGALVAACLPAVTGVAVGHGIEAWGARAEIIFALALLTLRPRTARSHAARIIPRMFACIAICLSALVAAATQAVQPWVAAGAVLAIGGALSLVGAFTLLRRSAWWGRLGDVFERLSAFLILPTAVVAAGLIEVMRQL
ncbi:MULTISPECIES: hypothetical protein [Actinomyces]|uniref:Type VII secretion integral membrane protein EccD n=1 Tax=Actinomyces glycerinitolerans TaxID=1892869 RepID=A0A1M4RZD0_9ACTO|nr:MULTISPECIES: hypothetical protein [Actinomyces]MBM6980335.1 secretion protein [Actinomyces succiniciruminis]RAX20180.1 secretion protein [Actinomyces sp. Z5]RAX24329.1 secretion protein [Actinomyces sp. Z3]SHE25326.1 Hypothetical protein ACGLYG10_1542 [Actinomyces glycerinitolerans]